MNLRMTDAALAEDGDDLVLRGVIDPETIDALKVDSYQREVESLTYIEQIARGYRTKSVADIDLGMRGGNYDESDGSFTLKDPVFIVDGFQRVTAARLALQQGVRPLLGAALRFNTTYAWEKVRFQILNANRKRVSPNIHLRNLRSDFAVVELLYDLSTREQGFPLYGRVGWQQNRRSSQLVSATTLLKCAGRLHARFGAGRSVTLSELVPSMQATLDRVGPATYRQNLLVFFGVMQECWGINRIVFTNQAAVLRGNFLDALARLLDEHDEFWNDKQLAVPPVVRRKLQSFPVGDPHVQLLASGGSSARLMLYDMLVAHVNSGRRTQRLGARPERALAGASA
jgi:hypothetical protein